MDTTNIFFQHFAPKVRSDSQHGCAEATKPITAGRGIVAWRQKPHSSCTSASAMQVVGLADDSGRRDRWVDEGVLPKTFNFQPISRAPKTGKKAYATFIMTASQSLPLSTSRFRGGAGLACVGVRNVVQGGRRYTVKSFVGYANAMD